MRLRLRRAGRTSVDRLSLLSLIACAPLRGLVADTRAADPLHLVTAWRNSPNTRTPPQSTVVPRRPVMPRPTGQVPLPACLLAAGV